MAISAVLGDLVKQFEKQFGEAKKANIERYAEAKNLYDEVIRMFQPGGSFDIGMESQLGRSRQKAIAQGTQALVSSGLYGTTQQAGLGKKFEEEVGLPARERMESYRAGQLAKATEAKAGVIERREDEYPDYRTIAGLTQQATAAPKIGYQSMTEKLAAARRTNPYMR
jgi:hypothetical protein